MDRRTKLLHLSNARAAAGNQSLPQSVRDKYQSAADHLGLSVDLENALNQQQATQVASSLPGPEAPPNQQQQASKDLQPVPNLLA
jgi:hypothetical protein